MCIRDSLYSERKEASSAWIAVHWNISISHSTRKDVYKRQLVVRDGIDQSVIFPSAHVASRFHSGGCCGQVARADSTRPDVYKRQVFACPVVISLSRNIVTNFRVLSTTKRSALRGDVYKRQVYRYTAGSSLGFLPALLFLFSFILLWI